MASKTDFEKLMLLEISESFLYSEVNAAKTTLLKSTWRVGIIAKIKAIVVLANCADKFLQASLVMEDALHRCHQQIGSMAEVYISSNRPGDHDCAGEIQSVLKYMVIKPAIDKVEEILK